jgi:hypothetical protein
MPEEECDPRFKEILVKIQVHLVTSGDEQLGWIHTHGMEEWDLPNLEIRGVPLFLGSAATSLLNHVATYMVEIKEEEDRKVQLGERMQTGPMAIFQFVELPPIKGDEAHFEHPRWSLSDEPMRSMCADPGHSAT